MSSEIIRDIVNLQRGISRINTEIPDAGITLTRTAIQAITTAGTIIVWQQKIRGQGITWSGSQITIPSSGWYSISMMWVTGAALTSMVGELWVNGARVHVMTIVPNSNGNSFTFMRYFTAGNIVQIGMIPSANTDVAVRPENGLAESPILNIVQLSNQAEV